MKSKGHKVSIITVCLNSGSTIESTMISVLNQTYKNIEYIVIDGGSCDNTVDIIRKYETQIHYWCSETDSGIYDAMNKGISIASGEFVAFMNSGDSYLENAVENMIEAYEHSTADILYGDYILRENGREIPRSARDVDINDFHVHMVVCHQTMFARRELFEVFGKFDIKYRIAADYEWIVRVMNRGENIKFQYIPAFICYFLAGGISMTDGVSCLEEMRQIACASLLTEQDAEKYMQRIQDFYEKSVQSTSYFQKTEGLLKKDIQRFTWLIRKYLVPGEVVYIFGSGLYGSECIKWCETIGIQIAGVVDNDESKWTTFIGKYEIASPEIVSNCSHKIIIAIKKYEDEIMVQLCSMGFEKDIHFICMSDMINAVVSAG